MTPEEWKKIKTILEPALELAGSERAAFLAANCADEAIRGEVEVLIATHEEAGTDFLNGAAPAFLVEDEARFRLVQGKRIGAYEILGEVAKGGMGAVYRAVRADGQYKQEVALKIVRAEFGAELTAARFRNERQILASLDHPNIAKILDGGSTVEGLPYFVMEFIDGLPITEYCDRKALPVDARLELFRTVCSAVHYAHQRLVIHRDIKPSNILVTADGVPKLLDFGIAKLLDPTRGVVENQTLTAGGWMLTPEYASPEQLRAEAVTTATDEYSLALVLYELLTGRRAYTLTSYLPQEIAEAVCKQEPERPSKAVAETKRIDGATTEPQNKEKRSEERGTTPAKLEKQLRGDLDNIVLMALRKEPSRRYASVEQFAEDIRRHQEYAPVLARNDTLWYRTSTFAKRHKAAAVASTAILLAICIGLAVTLYEARVARKQAGIAEAQRQRAERRFNDVRKLANSLIFEVHDSIKDLPGATPARQLLLDRALEYLDGLAQEAKGDITLQRELASAYDRIGDLRGYTGAANLGDYTGAMASYDKALAIRETAAVAAPNDRHVQADLLNSYFHLSFVLDDAGNSEAALEKLRKALPVAQKLNALQGDASAKDWLAGIYWKTGSVLEQRGDYGPALDSFRQAAAMREPLVAANPGNGMFRTHLAADYLGLGSAQENQGEIAAGLDNLQKGSRILEEVAQGNANNATLREYLGEAYSKIAPALKKQGRLDESLDYSKKANKIFAELLAADPTDSLAKINEGLTDLHVGEILLLQGKMEAAAGYEQKAIASFRGTEKSNRYELAGEAQAYASLANTYCALAGQNGRRAEKTESLRNARMLFERSKENWQAYQELVGNEQLATRETAKIGQELAACGLQNK